jgi:hypothetical protein
MSYLELTAFQNNRLTEGYFFWRIFSEVFALSWPKDEGRARSLPSERDLFFLFPQPMCGSFSL